jgi:hypothetical protein
MLASLFCFHGLWLVTSCQLSACTHAHTCDLQHQQQTYLLYLPCSQAQRAQGKRQIPSATTLRKLKLRLDVAFMLLQADMNRAMLQSLPTPDFDEDICLTADCFTLAVKLLRNCTCDPTCLYDCIVQVSFALISKIERKSQKFSSHLGAGGLRGKIHMAKSGTRPALVGFLSSSMALGLQVRLASYWFACEAVNAD